VVVMVEVIVPLVGRLYLHYSLRVLVYAHTLSSDIVGL
jgi:hypothetical protein